MEPPAGFEPATLCLRCPVPTRTRGGPQRLSDLRKQEADAAKPTRAFPRIPGFYGSKHGSAQWAGPRSGEAPEARVRRMARAAVVQWVGDPFQRREVEAIIHPKMPTEGDFAAGHPRRCGGDQPRRGSQ
ncbi:hypothetical protein GCM10028789_26870 [Sinomonas halotolerans]